MARTGDELTVRERSPVGWIWDRSLERYPERGPRVMYLTIVVVATIMLYYELYVTGAVGPTVIAHYGMTFRYYVYGVGVFAGIAGAFFSLLAGMGDRWGRANLVTYGLLVTAVLVLLLPSMPTKFWYMFLIAAIGAVEGVVLVATPALVRDFSPQMGRASAMGFWTLGPVCGSLVVSIVSSNTLTHLRAWQDQFTICGIAGLGLFLTAFFGLRELSPNLRNQLMVSMRDRMLIEARAKGVDVAAGMKNPWRQMVKWDLVLPAFGAATLLLIYYAMVGFLVIYFSGLFHFTTQRSNALGNWFWSFDAGALVLVGFLSDRFRVRKPFMVFGAVVAIVMTIVFLTRATQPDTSFTTFVIIMSILAFGLGFAYAPWFAAFTETAEKRNPALIATGLAVNGWVLRAVVTVSALLLPIVVASMTPIVTYGTNVETYLHQYATEVKTASAVPAPTQAALKANPTTTKAVGVAVTAISTKLHVSSTVALGRLVKLGKVANEPGFKYLIAHGPAVTAAAAQAPKQWQHWWWVCVAGEIVFLPTVLLLSGRWSPRTARRDAEEHERMVEAELARLRAPTGEPPPASAPSPTPSPTTPTTPAV